MSRITLTSGTDAEWFYPRLLIAHQSGTVTASSTATGYTASAVSSPLTYTGWKGASLPDTIETDYGSSKTIDYIAFGAAVSITKAGPYAWMKITGVSATKTRLSVTGTTAPVIAFICSGAATAFPCGIPPGFAPASLNQDDEFTNTFSEGGQILGSQKLRSSSKQSVSMDAISPSWVTTNWPTVRGLMNRNGMFFAFNPKDAADELIYGMRGKDSPLASYSSTQYMALSFSIEGPEIEL
jgi:hypothetical protein